MLNQNVARCAATFKWHTAMAGAMATKYAELAEQIERHTAMAGAMRECAGHHLLEAAGYKERMEDYTRELRSKGGGKGPKGPKATAQSCAPKVAPVQKAIPKSQPRPKVAAALKGAVSQNLRGRSSQMRGDDDADDARSRSPVELRSPRLPRGPPPSSWNASELRWESVDQGLQPVRKRERTPAVVRSSSAGGSKDAKQGKKPRIPEGYEFIKCRKPNCNFGVSPYQNCGGHCCQKCSTIRKHSHGEYCLKIEEFECM